MFLNVADPIEFTAPWHVPFSQRLAMLAGGRRRIAYFYDTPDTSTFRYRALNPVESINMLGDGSISASWFTVADLAGGMNFIDHTDMLVFCRTRYGPRVASLIASAKTRGVPIFFDCDDLVFDPDRAHLVLDSLNIADDDHLMWESFFGYVARINQVFKRAEAVISTNSYLLDRADEARPGLPRYELPNYLNEAQQMFSSQMYYKKLDCMRDESIIIGYFSGSPTHVKDFAVALPAIRRLMSKDPRVKLRIVGFPVFIDQLNEFEERIEIVPVQDYMNLQRYVAEVEINVAPLQENQFTNCKSDLKFFEAAACGTLTLASPTHAFSRAIDHGKTGLLVPAYGWDHALTQAVELVDDRVAYQRITDAAFDHVERTYGFDRFGEQIARIFLEYM